MADIRIKDLTTEVSSTATGDFFVIDGTTGTRKTPAFNPTFGGNATVTGTLTVNGAATSINVTNSGGLLNFSGTGNTTTIKEVRMVNSGGGDWMSLGITGSAYAGVLTGLGNDEPFIYAPATFRIFRGTGLTNRFDFAADQLKINATTASTTTSSGALVVSGGVGVAGAIYAGNAINATVNGGASIIGRNGSASSFTSIVAYSGASDEVKGTLTSSTAGVIIVGSQTNHPLAVYVNNAEVARWDTSANFQTRVTGTAPSLATNSTMTFELTSNTSLKIFVRGSDGTTRSTTLTLA